MDVQVSLVITYDLRANRENDIHRTGRGDCFGHKGVAINTVTRQEDSSRQCDFLHFHVADLI